MQTVNYTVPGRPCETQWNKETKEAAVKIKADLCWKSACVSPNTHERNFPNCHQTVAQSINGHLQWECTVDSGRLLGSFQGEILSWVRIFFFIPSPLKYISPSTGKIQKVNKVSCLLKFYKLNKSCKASINVSWRSILIFDEHSWKLWVLCCLHCYVWSSIQLLS